MKSRLSHCFAGLASLALLIAFILVAPSGAAPPLPQSAAAPAETFKIAILAPLSGPVSAWGISARNAALLAVEQQNAAGGLLGLQIVPVVEDSGCNATLAAAATHKVLDQHGVRYILGDVCSSPSLAMSEITNPAGVIQVSPSATSAGLTLTAGGQVKQYIFRAAFIDAFQGAAAARFAREDLGADTAFILVDPNHPYIGALADGFQAEFSRAGLIVGKATYKSGDQDFSAALAQVAAAQPDLVFHPAYPDAVNPAIQQARAMGLTMPFLGGDGWESPELDRAAAAGSYFVSHLSWADPRPQVAEFAAAYTARYGAAPDVIGALAYDTARLIFQAVSAAGTADTAAVAAELAAIDFEGVTGSFYYDTAHNPVKSAAALRVQPGGDAFVGLIQPAKPAADVTVNYAAGSPGSEFTVRAANFPPNGEATVTVNGRLLAATVPINGAGEGEFRLATTAETGEGLYLVKVSVNPSATARFTLDADAPLRPAESTAPQVPVPPGIAINRSLYLPVLRR